MAAPMEADDPRDPLFKGCTRPAMIMGVPLVPFAIALFVVVLAAVWTTFFVAGLLVPIVLVMRLIVKSDDQMFRLLGLKILFRVINLNRNGTFWRASAYSPIPFKKRK